MQILVNQFEIENEMGLKIVSEGEDYLFWIRMKLSERIFYLLNNDHNLLFALLYRIDVNEDLVKNALNNASIKDASDILADLIINRQLQKNEWKNKNT